jgi:chorismate mutase
MTYEDEVAELRKEINRLNVEIIEKIVKRIDVANEIALIKRRYGKPIVDKQRERAVLDQIRFLAKEKGADPDGAERVFAEIIRLCVESEESL